MKIYFLRHQAGGVVVQYPFAHPPTEVQQEAVAREMFQTFGAEHPKTGEAYWLKVVEVDVLGRGEVPVVPERGLRMAGPAAAAGDMFASGTGHVTNP
jgi:hypothetical protein